MSTFVSHLSPDSFHLKVVRNRYGNSGVCHISDQETWVAVAEGRVSHGPRKGENNQVFLVKIITN